MGVVAVDGLSSEEGAEAHGRASLARSDYGVIDETQVGIARTRVSVLLCRRGGEPSFVIKESALAWLGFSVRYTKFGRESLLELKRALDDALMRVT